MEIAKVPDGPVLQAPGPMSNFGLMRPDLFDHAWRCAEVYAATAVVPADFQNRPADCLIVLDLAARLEVSPFMLFQNVGMVHGKPSIEAKVAIALINERGPFAKPLEWKLEGDGMTRQATCIGTYPDGSTAEMVVSMKIAKAEGWLDKKGSKWKTMPDQMLRYRSAKWLANAYCPGVLLGLLTQDEAGEIIEVEATVIEEAESKPTRRKAPAKRKPKAEKPAPPATPPKEEAPAADEQLPPIPEAPPAEPPPETLSLVGVLASAKINAAHATDYCRAQGYIKTQTGSLRDIDDEVQNRIISNVQGFAEAMEKWRAEQNN